MISTHIVARFVGPYKSLGYIPEREYVLRVWWDKHWLWVDSSDEETEACPYNSMEALLRNWAITTGEQA